MKLNTICFYSFLFSIPLLLFAVSCSTTEPPPIVPPPDIIKDTITVSIESFTHRSVTLRVQSTVHSSLSSIKVLRSFNSIETIIAEFPLEVADTTITDDDNGIGLLLDTTYTFFAVRVDSLGELKDTSNIITQKTLAPTSHDYTWQEYTFGDAGYPNTLYDVWGTDENNVWACGGVKINDKNYSVLHYDGTQWLPVEDTVGGTAIFGFSENEIWVAGGGVYFFDGINWRRVDAKFTPTQIIPLDTVLFNNSPYTSLWGTSSSNLYLGNNWGKIIHWDGVKAEIVYEKSGYRIADIEGSSNSNIYAVGGEQGGNFQDLYLFYDGVEWREDNNLYHISPSTVLSLSEKDNYAAGGNILFGEFGNWELQEDPASQYIHKIRGSKSNDLLAVGAYNLIMHYNGESWFAYNDLINLTGGVLYSAFPISSKVYVVGVDDSYSKAKIITGTKQ